MNFGHTVGHALEASTGFEMLHGEAVAIGMVLEAELGAKLGVTDKSAAGRLRATLDQFGLPTVLPAAANPRTVVAGMFRDKKVRRGRIRMTFLERLGRVARDAQGNWTHSVDPDAIAVLLESGS